MSTMKKYQYPVLQSCIFTLEVRIILPSLDPFVQKREKTNTMTSHEMDTQLAFLIHRMRQTNGEYP